MGVTVAKLVVLWMTFHAESSMVTSEVEEVRIGVLLTTQKDAPYSVERAGVAIQMAIERVNQEYLTAGTVNLTYILQTYGPFCDATLAPGKQAVA